MNTIILTLQTTSKTADPVKKTGIAAEKNQIKNPLFKKKHDTQLFYYFNNATVNNRELL